MADGPLRSVQDEATLALERLNRRISALRIAEQAVPQELLDERSRLAGIVVG